MHPEDMHFIADLVHARSGLALTPDKDYLVESRLMPIARGRGYGSLAELFGELRERPAESLLVEITEALMTHETSFFRDGKPFEHLRHTILPQLHAQAAARRHLRIWSAACSTGQEPYSLAMLLLENASSCPGWRYEILATDLAEKAVEKAHRGLYSQFEAQRGMPIQMLLKYFTSQPDTSWQARNELRTMVRFTMHNLLKDRTPPGPFDLILCRNVLIYFDDKSKATVLRKLEDALHPGGFLILGSAESIMGRASRLFQPEGMHGIYQAPSSLPLIEAVKRKITH